MKIMTKRMLSGEYHEVTWAELALAAAEDDDCAGAIESAQATARNTARILGALCDVLVGHNVVPEQALFDLLTEEDYRGRFKLVGE